ncbi:hypothetical protein M2150_001093 [Lachnospiraceae bacterium PM6-15]|uniref:hypothetical protein n=1 Tax=Ohessyouella blattaphilus TaxID=2949333 RepID=UPI002560DADE|nr:hypothetical protein [Lachnospiraceae bacterium OttesenSCG-928-J05]
MKGYEYPVNSLRICVDEAGEEVLTGRICGVALKEPLSFTGLLDFIAKVDDAYNDIGQPQQHRVLRSFTEENRYTSYVGAPKKYHTAGEIDACLGAYATIEMVMTSRQGAEWQGLVKDLEKNILGKFATILECTDILREKNVIV